MPQWALELLRSAPVARLGMLDSTGGPRVLPIVFAVHEGVIWSVVDAKPKRVVGERLARLRFIARDPRVALCVDHYQQDWRRLCWLQVLGCARVVALGDEEEARGALGALVAKYEVYRTAPPPGPLVRIAPQRCICWRAEEEAAA